MGLTPDQVRELCKNASAPLPSGMSDIKPASKMRNRKKEVDGILFDSTLESQVYRILKQWESIGKISDLKLQPVFLLQKSYEDNGHTIRSIKYIPDFQYERHGAAESFTHVIDAKGHRTDVYRMKVKMFRARYPDIVFSEWTKEDLKRYGG